MIFYKSLKPIKAVSFDLDDTLYDNKPIIGAAEEWFAQMLWERYKLPRKTACYDFWAEVKNREAFLHPELEDDVTLLRARSLVTAFMELGKPLPGGLDEGLSLTREFIHERSKITVPESSFALLKTLGERYPLAALSNGNSDTKQDGLAPYFKYDLRPQAGGPRRKPFPDLWLKFAESEGIKPGEILHVGDEPYSDINGAVKAGCQCAFLKDGIAGKSPGVKDLRALPTVELSSLGELLTLLL